MTSIRARLFVILLLATGLVWLSAVIWIQHSSRSEVGLVLDRRLEESARMLASLIGDGVDVGVAAQAGGQGPADYPRQLSCQIWGFDGRLIGGSSGAPETSLADGAAGFSDSVVGGERWRVYTLVDEGRGIRVMVGDAYRVRDRLVGGVTLALLLPALLVLPLLAGLIWWAVGHGLSPLTALAAVLARRSADDLSVLPESPAPRELGPLTRALNTLFRRLEAARLRERSFIAFAAHELKTPLAGLRMQAQVAAMAAEAETRDKALAQLIRGVDRTDRMVRQLLDLTAVGDAPVPVEETLSARAILAEVVGDLSALAAERQVSLSATEAAEMVLPAPSLLSTALRNLVENAIYASPAGSEVLLSVRKDGGHACICVVDRGTGVSDADRPHVAEHFWRGVRAEGPGSGLGLAIVATVMDRLCGEFRLSPRPGGGEVAELLIPV